MKTIRIHGVPLDLRNPKDRETAVEWARGAIYPCGYHEWDPPSLDDSATAADVIEALVEVCSGLTEALVATATTKGNEIRAGLEADVAVAEALPAKPIKVPGLGEVSLGCPGPMRPHDENGHYLYCPECRP